MSVDVAFITVNYNTCRLVEELLRFFRSTPLPFSYSLVVVDNGSSDGSDRMLEQAHGNDLIPLLAGENLGYGRAMNRGLAAVESRYACIMNTDLILNREALVALWDFFEGTPTAGVASPVIMGSDRRIQGFIFHPGILSLYSPTVSKIRSKRWKIRVQRAVSPLRVPGVLGAFFMIRRTAFGDTPLFDEDFFFYYEDTELAHRYWTHNIACHVLPEVSITHLGGQSTSAAGGRLFQQSRRIYIEKCHGTRHAAFLQRLDRIRLWSKYFKYRLVTRIFENQGLRAKHDYYSRLVKQHDRQDTD